MSSRATRIAFVAVTAAIALLVAVAFHRGYGRGIWHPYYRSMSGPRTVQTVLAEVGPRHRPTLEGKARELGIEYPPPSLTLVGLKQERALEACSYHLSIRVDYPNAFDRARGTEDGRSNLGGDIYIHGKAVSIGCLAIGDDNIEELFTLVADTGLAHARILLAPGRVLDAPAGAPAWTRGLYRTIAGELATLRH